MKHTSRIGSLSFLLLAVACGPALVACSGTSPLGEVFGDPPPWEHYAASLEAAHLDGTALGREWIAAGRRALDQAPAVETPYREAGYLAPDRPGAIGYRLFLRRGHQLEIDVEMRSSAPSRLFLDLFRAPPPADSLARPERVASAAADSAAAVTRLDFEVPRDGDYIVRLQPGLLRGGRYEITVRKTPTLAFPVEGAANRDIGSGWGDPRDGGSRSHRGVDIFAPRGTPALAVEAGRVRRAGTNRLGGNTVWLSGDDGRSFYYAHLDRRAVRSGDEVGAGDTLGWVGNTGNASRTPPHLHFGVRLRGGPGYVDPYPYIARTETSPAPVTVDTARFGEWIRARGDVNLRSGPGTETEILQTLPASTVARALGGTADWYRVELPDRSTGFMWASITEDLATPVGRLGALDSLEPSATAGPRLVRDGPSVLAAPVDSVGTDADVPVLGRFGDWRLVRTGGRDGWVLGAEGPSTG
jgi:murein DD-endopeptidase MepM/ murein hydrolase activator NlpD